MTKGVLSSVNSREVKLLVSSPRLASGNSLRRNLQDFESLSETTRFTRVCERHRVSAGMSCKTKHVEDDGFWTVDSVMQRIYVFSSKPPIQSLCSNSWRNNIGPISEVQIEKIIDQYGLAIAIPSTNDTQRTLYVLISRGKSRFVDEIDIPNAELRSSAELLSERQKSEGAEPCLTKSKTGTLETGAVHVTSPTSINETCADTLSISPSTASVRMEELCQWRSPKWLQECCVITTKMNDNLTRHFIGTP